ncbi:MAG: nucleoside hydrolase [Erysipelotrichaceae bacterium]|nr:nucleoside hydrolase [Erysipelotrichaceae bacterium]
MEREKIIIDVDTGSDDAVALVAAMLSGELDLLGIMTVSGNVDINNATDNTLRVVKCCGKENETKVYRGASLPLASTLVPWGIQGQTLPRTEKPVDPSIKIHPDHLPLPEAEIKEEDQRAAGWLVETMLKMPDESVTLVPVGPQTNIALAIRSDERILKKIKRVVMMGGSHDHYAPTQGAEFNVWVDPEAVEIVLTSGLDVTMVSLDATSDIALGKEEADAIRKIGTRPAILVADMIEQRLNAAARTLSGSKGQVVGIALHDPLAVCAVTHPEVLTDIWDTSCHVDLGRGFAYGETVLGRNYQTVIDENGEHVDLPDNVHYARHADREFFYKWLYGILEDDKKNRI